MRARDSPGSQKCHTYAVRCMTVFSFGVDNEEAEETRRLAERLGVDRSEVLGDALHRHLIRLRAEQEVES